jgi:tetratricopeptide (TPR) repeat protein
VLARVLRAYLALYSTASSGFERARSLVDDLDAWSLSAGERERLHVLAVQSWACGEWERAARFLERALFHDPRDLLALKVGQDLFFFLGKQHSLRDVVGKVFGTWDPECRGYGYVCGMYAFGLEENGQYQAAEQRARRALDENPRDVWAVHAQAHVFEMQGAAQAGIAFLDHCVEDWSSSYFAIHNWWHRALYALELRAVDEAVALFDGPVRGTRSGEWLDMVDAASLLWRLHLFGQDVQDRASTLSGDIEHLLGDPVYVFNDWHAVMAAGLAGSHELSEQLIAVNRSVTGGTNRRSIEAAGLGLLEGFSAFASGDAATALCRLLEVRPRAHAVGGSHAQRDVVDLTIMAAAARVGDAGVAEALLADRLKRRPSGKAAGLELLRANGLG